MAKLEWDKTGERFVENGVSKGVLYPQSSDGTYPQGVAWNGLTAVNESPDGAEPNDLVLRPLATASALSLSRMNGMLAMDPLLWLMVSTLVSRSARLSVSAGVPKSAMILLAKTMMAIRFISLMAPLLLLPTRAGKLSMTPLMLRNSSGNATLTLCL